MKIQAGEISTIADNIRAYYTDNIVKIVQESDGYVTLSENYRDVHGGIPIPATLSLELGTIFDAARADGRISYKFTSQYPFKNRSTRQLDEFEIDSIKKFEENPTVTASELFEHKNSADLYRLATPVRMKKSCVTCHNSHKNSPKRDWKVGDLRGIQVVGIKNMEVSLAKSLNQYFLISILLGLVSLVSLCIIRVKQKTSEKKYHILKDNYDQELKNSADIYRILDETSVFKEAIEKSSVGISISDMTKEGNPTIYVNKAFVDLTGYPKDFVIGKNCRFLQGPETENNVKVKIREAIDAKRRFQGKITNYRADGTQFKNNLILVPIFSESDDSRLIYYVANQSIEED